MKMSTSMNIWQDIHNIEGGLSAIFICGDYIDEPDDYGDAMVTLVENELHDYTKVPSYVPRFYVIGNHDWNIDHDAADFMVAVDANVIQTSQNEGEYFYYDVGNIRIIALAGAYNEDGARKPTGGVGYLPSEQLIWLEDRLQEADDAGKYSVIMCHYNLEAASNNCYPATISNSSEVLEILLNHRVACWIAGHQHSDFAHNSYQRKNKYGARIFFKGLEAMVDDTGVSNFATLYINDQTGQVYMKGHDNCSGKRTLIYVGNSAISKSNPGYYENWAIVDYDVLGLSSEHIAPESDSMPGVVNVCASVTQSGDILIIGQDAVDAGVTFIQRANMNQSSSYKYCHFPLEVHIEEAFQGEIGRWSLPGDWLEFSSISCLFLKGGFDDTQDGDYYECESGIHTRLGIGYLEAMGGADNQPGNGGKFKIWGGRDTGYNDASVNYAYIDLDNPGPWEISFQDL